MMVYTAVIPDDIAEMTGVSGSFQIIRMGFDQSSKFYAEMYKMGYTDEKGEPYPACVIAYGVEFARRTVISVPHQLGADIDEALARMDNLMGTWLVEEVYRLNAPLERKESSGSSTPTNSELQTKL